jgi:hypothetical protein
MIDVGGRAVAAAVRTDFVGPGSLLARPCARLGIDVEYIDAPRWGVDVVNAGAVRRPLDPVRDRHRGKAVR